MWELYCSSTSWVTLAMIYQLSSHMYMLDRVLDRAAIGKEDGPIEQ
jgi:hypothetical protein